MTSNGPDPHKLASKSYRSTCFPTETSRQFRLETRAPHVLQRPHVRVVMGSSQEMSAFPPTILGCFLSLRIRLESVWDNSPVTRALPQEGAFSSSAGHAFPAEGAFPICPHTGVAELVGTQQQVLGQEERALAALWLQRSSAWGRSCIQTHLQQMHLFCVFFFHANGKKKNRQKGCNRRFVSPKCVTGEMTMYKVASTHPAAHHPQTGARLAPS